MSAPNQEASVFVRIMSLACYYRQIYEGLEIEKGKPSALWFTACMHDIQHFFKIPPTPSPTTKTKAMF